MSQCDVDQDQHLKHATVGEALIKIGLSPDPFSAASIQGDVWHFELFGLCIPLYNFGWRRRALPFHDLHHVVTSYPCTMRGEMQIATWEFAAGPFENRFAQLFCLPLVAIGAVVMPQKQFTAYRNGLRRRSLFTLELDSSVSQLTVTQLDAMTRRSFTPIAFWREIIGYSALVGASLLMYVLPVLVLRWWLLPH